MNESLYILSASALAFFAWLRWRNRVRAGQVRSLAESLGFHYLGATVPSSLPLNDAPFTSITSVWNVIDGERSGRRVVAFDCRFGEGKGSWRRTVLAVHADRVNITASRFDSNIRVEQAGDWTFLYRPKELVLITQQLTPVAELGAYLETL